MFKMLLTPILEPLPDTLSLTTRSASSITKTLSVYLAKNGTNSGEVILSVKNGGTKITFLFLFS